MSKGFRIGQVVDRNKVYVRVTESGPHDVASDAPESVDPNFNSHYVMNPSENL
jgi:hypothetical protein